MSKIIKLTPEYLAEVRREFEESLASLKVADGKISFTKTFAGTGGKATVYFTEIAWQKMQALIRGFDKEIAWHGIAYRGENPELNEYTITDILVYPQEVTGATVTTDQVQYQDWLMAFDDDVFNNIRMQGHSHVNMSTSPSAVDSTLYERMLDQLEDDMFYIFLIYNKRGECTYKIYDLAKNTLFETGDVTVKILGDGFDMDAFMADAKAKVQTRTPQYGGGVTFGGNYNTAATQKSTAPAQTASVTPVKKQDGKKNISLTKFCKEKGKKEAEGKKTDRWASAPRNSGSTYDFYDDPDGYCDPYGAFGYRDGRWY